MLRRILVLALVLPLLLACATTTPPEEEPAETTPAPESAATDGAGTPGEAEEIVEGESLDDESFWDSLFDREDGHLDLSEWLDQPAGFFPLAIPITEPAVGAGLVAGLVFFHPNDPDEEGEPVPPSISAVFGGATTNGTWLAGAGHMGVWYDDTIRYTGGAAAFNVNLQFYGLGEDAYERESGLDYSLKGWAIFQDIRFRVADTDLFLGAAYTFVNFKSEFDFNLDDEGIQPFESTDNIADLTLIAQYDARDNIFTPTDGFLGSAKYHIHDEVFGSDFEFKSVDLDLQVYVELAERLLLGTRAQYGWASDDAPFFLLPSVRMRGIPAMSILGNYMASLELEPRYNLTDRWAVVLFGGVGRVGLSPENFRDSRNIYAGGTGFRYLIAKKLGVWAGCDVAWSNDATAFYITFGSAWAGI